MSPWNHQALVSLRGDLKLRVQMETGLGDKLEKVAGGFMDEHEAQTVREQLGNKKQMDKVIEILLGKGDKEFNAFLKILRNSNNEVWAEELKNAANRFKRVKGMFLNREKESNQRCLQYMVNVTQLGQHRTMDVVCIYTLYTYEVQQLAINDLADEQVYEAFKIHLHC